MNAETVRGRRGGDPWRVPQAGLLCLDQLIDAIYGPGKSLKQFVLWMQEQTNRQIILNHLLKLFLHTWERKGHEEQSLYIVKIAQKYFVCSLCQSKETDYVYAGAVARVSRMITSVSCVSFNPAEDAIITIIAVETLSPSGWQLILLFNTFSTPHEHYFIQKIPVSYFF